MAKQTSGNSENGKELARLEDPSAVPGSGMTTPGSWMPKDADDLISAEGFSIIETLMIGDPADGKVPTYVGELIGPGEMVTVDTPDGKSNDLHTWIFKPITATGVVQNLTHVVPASHQVHAACARIHKHATDNNLRAHVVISFFGQTKTKKGRHLNQYRVAEKYSPRTVQTSG